MASVASLMDIIKIFRKDILLPQPQKARKQLSQYQAPIRLEFLLFFYVFSFFSSLEQCRIIQFRSNLIGSQHQDKGNGRFEETHGSTIGIHAILHTITVSVCIQYIRIVQDRIISSGAFCSKPVFRMPPIARIRRIPIWGRRAGRVIFQIR